MEDNLKIILSNLLCHIRHLSIEEKINAINATKTALHQISPFAHHPVDCVLWVKSSQVFSNDYNPNSVAPPEMQLLELSIKSDGYTQPIVTWSKDDDALETVDGYHRGRVGKESDDVRKATHGYLPVTIINEDRNGLSNRMASTIRHNRARGKHAVNSMSDIIIELSRRRWSDEKIATELGMTADEVLRLKQISGLAEMFSDKEFSLSWEINEDELCQTQS